MAGARRRMHEELKAVSGSARLAGQVAQCVGKALHLLAEKAEYMAATGATPSGLFPLPEMYWIDLLPAQNPCTTSLACVEAGMPWL